MTDRTGDIPVIDLSADREVVQHSMLNAYGDVGFGYLIGHDIADDLVAEVFDAARRFHALDHGTKMAIELDSRHRGYIPLGTSTDRNSELATVTRPNHSASFMMMREAGPADPDVKAGAFLAGPNQWPDDRAVTGFRSTLERYHREMTELAGRVVGLLLTALGADGAPAGSFEPPTTWLRLIHYPPQPPDTHTGTDIGTGTDGDGDLFGSAPHVDYGAVTLLAQDDVGGLQVRHPNGERWIEVPPRRGSFVLNTGAVMRRWSNGRLRATPHRVINRSGRERYSVPFFYDPHVATVIEPLACCVGSDRPARYEPLRFGDFLRAELAAGYDRHRSADSHPSTAPMTDRATATPDSTL